MTASLSPQKLARPIDLPTRVPIPFTMLARHLRAAGASWFTPQYTRRFFLGKGKEQLELTGKQDVWIKRGVHYHVTSLQRVRRYIPGLLEAAATVEELQQVIDELREEREAARVRERNQQREIMAMRKRMRDVEEQMENATLVLEGLHPLAAKKVDALDPWAGEDARG